MASYIIFKPSVSFDEITTNFLNTPEMAGSYSFIDLANSGISEQDSRIYEGFKAYFDIPKEVSTVEFEKRYGRFLYFSEITRDLTMKQLNLLDSCSEYFSFM